jgi:putative cell wall-binding protein
MAIQWLSALAIVSLGAVLLEPMAGSSVAAVAAELTPVAMIQQVDDTIDPAEMLGFVPSARQAPMPTQTDVQMAGVVSVGHTVDVAVVAPAGFESQVAGIITDPDALNLVARTGTYWKAQSNNQVLSVAATSATPLRYTTTATCDAVVAIWEDAASRFGHPVAYYLAATGHHLMVLVPNGCGGAGVGTVGIAQNDVNAADGGFVWASLNGLNNLDIVAHEFGHNLGLQHSNTIYCPDAALSEGLLDSATGTYSDGCSDRPYEDAYDVMGAAFSVNGIANTTPTALNIDHKTRLGAVATGEVQTIVLGSGQSSQSVVSTISTTGAASGRRALAVTDPRTNHVYWVDYRGGTGMDAGSLYTQGSLATSGVNNGVRLITSRDDGTSVVLQSPSAVSSNGHKLFLTVGESLSTRSQGITVTVQSIASGTATVSVTLKAAGTSRLSGADRYVTSAAISAASFAANARVVYIANGSNFPDALSGAPVAGKDGAPVLLVAADSIPDSIATELRRLVPERIVVLGGTSAVSDAVAAQLAAFTTSPGGLVGRWAGSDRYETSAAISSVNFAANANVVYVANGSNFPDALSGAPIAGAQKAPVLLLQADGIPASIQIELARLHPTSIVVLGGTSAVSDAVAQQLATFTANPGVPVTRSSGADRYATSAAISASHVASPAPVVYIANGSNFPDALSGAPVAGTRGAPVLLVSAGAIPDVIQSELTRLRPSKIVVLGGTNAVSVAVQNQLDTFIR